MYVFDMNEKYRWKIKELIIIIIIIVVITVFNWIKIYRIIVISNKYLIFGIMGY